MKKIYNQKRGERLYKGFTVAAFIHTSPFSSFPLLTWTSSPESKRMADSIVSPQFPQRDLQASDQSISPQQNTILCIYLTHSFNNLNNATSTVE
jgi:hypothetical protein